MKIRNKTFILDVCCRISCTNEVFVFIHRIPLSAPVFLANWQIAEGEPDWGNSINCPVEERQLKVKVNWTLKYSLKY